MPAVPCRCEAGLERRTTPTGLVLFFAVVFKFSSSLAKHKPETILKLKNSVQIQQKSFHIDTARKKKITTKRAFVGPSPASGGWFPMDTIGAWREAPSWGSYRSLFSGHFLPH